MIATIDGQPFAYNDVGTGLPVVFVHGFPHDRSLWSAQLGALAVPARTMAPDLRGFGESAGVASSIDDYAADLERWLALLGISSAVFVGVSMGGYVLFSLWRRAPELVRALVLADTRAGADDAAARDRRDAHIALVETRGADALADQLVQGTLGKSTRNSRPELVERVHGMLARAPEDGVVGALRAMRDRPDSTPLLESIDVPTLIVVGDEDVITPVAEGRAMHAAIPDSRLEIIAGAGHLSPVERPAAVNHVLAEFLSPLAYT